MDEVKTRVYNELKKYPPASKNVPFPTHIIHDILRLVKHNSNM